jgi:hypothetical protein
VKHTLSLFTLALMVLVGLAVAGLAEVPNMINYQGILTDAGGDPVADDTYELTFKIYDQTPTERWSEVHTVTTVDGLFSVMLGSNGSPLTEDIFDYAECWLGITITGEGELTPRTQLIATPYAFRISTVDGASGGVISGEVTILDNLTITGDLQVVGDVVGATPWTAFPFATGYDDYEDGYPESGFPRAQYRKIGDVVYLRGLIYKEDHNVIPAGALLGTLPLGFRPAASVYFYADPWSGIKVMPSGDVVAPEGDPYEHMWLHVVNFSTSP